MKKLTSLLTLLLIGSIAFAQTDSGPILDMRSSGKVYVVIAVLLIVFIGIAAYLFSIDKRLKKIERGN